MTIRRPSLIPLLLVGVLAFGACDLPTALSDESPSSKSEYDVRLELGSSSVQQAILNASQHLGIIQHLDVEHRDEEKAHAAKSSTPLRQAVDNVLPSSNLRARFTGTVTQNGGNFRVRSITGLQTKALANGSPYPSSTEAFRVPSNIAFTSTRVKYKIGGSWKTYTLPSEVGTALAEILQTNPAKSGGSSVDETIQIDPEQLNSVDVQIEGDPISYFTSQGYEVKDLGGDRLELTRTMGKEGGQVQVVSVVNTQTRRLESSSVSQDGVVFLSR